MQAVPDMTELPPTSLIICTRNRPELLCDTVNSILAGRVVPTELVIVDQSDSLHPPPPMPKTYRPCEIRHLPSRSIGLSRARNEGIAAARFEWLIFTDDDMLLDRDWFDTLMRTLVLAGPKAVVTGSVRPSESEVEGGFVPSATSNESAVIYEGRVAADVLFPANMAMHRSAFQSVGLFDERLGAGTRFPGAEDNDLCLRLLDAGYRIVYEPQAITYHRAWRSPREYVPMRWKYGLGQGAFFAKHFSWRDRFMIRRAIASLWEHTSRNVRYAFRRSRVQVLGDAVYILGILSGITQWLLIRGK
jgi:GT2 family glycosyltransferase